MKHSVSLILSTYNWPEALELCLLSIKKQRLMPDEIIIADDGSTDETRQLIEFFKQGLPTKLIHVWHEDKGFRQYHIINKAICKSSSDYIVIIDGDCILHRHFVKDHLVSAKKGTFLTGSRSYLDKRQTKKSHQEKNIHFNFFSRGLSNRFNTIRIPNFTCFTRFMISNNPAGSKFKVRGCNMSFWRSDLFLVNGFDESMSGWGLIDYDIAIRLMNSGIHRNRIKHMGIQYHQNHNSNKDEKLYQQNYIIFQETIKTGRIRCEEGLSNHCKDK